MLGAIIGDIVGSRWEFNPTNDYNFEWLSDENGFTDDTICTVAVADAAAATAIPSHNHDEGIKGAQTVAMAIVRALQHGHEAPQYINEILEDGPFKGCWAFPGGFMNMDETTEQCAIRELEGFIIDIKYKTN